MSPKAIHVLHKRRYFLRLFSAMLSVCLLGILVTGVASFVLTRRAVDREVVNTHSAMLEQVRASLEEQYGEVYNVFAMLSTDANINKAIFFDEAIEPDRLFIYQAIIRSLNSIEVSHPAIHMVWLHLNRSNAILVSSAKYPYNFFVETRLSQQEKRLFEAARGQEFSFRLLVDHETSEQDTALLYAASLPMSANRPHCTAYASIRPETLASLLDPMVREEALILLTDGQGNPLAYRQNGLDEDTVGAVLTAVVADMGQEGWISISSGRYFVMRTHARVSDTHVFAVLPAMRMQQAAISIAHTTGLTMLAACAVLFVFVYIWSKSQYKPIRLLMDSAARFAQSPDAGGLSDAVPDAPEGSSRTQLQDEIRFIDSMLQLSFEDNENLRRLVDKTRQTVSAQLLRGLLSGQLLQEEAARGELGFTSGVYQVLFFEREQHEAIDMPIAGQEQAFGGLRWRAVWVNRDMAVITEMDEGHEHPDVLYALAESLQAAFIRQGQAVTVGIGGAYRQLDGVQASFAQARAAARHAHVRGQGTVIHINEVPQEQGGTFRYPADDEQRIMNCIKAGDGEAAWQAILALIHGNTTDRAPLPALISTLYCAIMNTYYRTATESSLPHAPEQGPVPTSLEDFTARMPVLKAHCMGLARDAGERRQSANQLLYDQVCAFIRANYAGELSLDVLSEHTGYSVSYISYVFKQVSGENYVDYVNRYRICRAKDLLSDTDLPIADIATGTGFISHTNFSRTFKRLEGVAPGQYRLSMRRAKKG